MFGEGRPISDNGAICPRPSRWARHQASALFFFRRTSSLRYDIIGKNKTCERTQPRIIDIKESVEEQSNRHFTTIMEGRVSSKRRALLV